MPEVCDSYDNNCDGNVNENVINFGKPCYSDDGLAPPGHGLCRTQGTYVCNGANSVRCSAGKASCTSLSGGCTELCDGVDNDCDGDVDEPFAAKGLDSIHFVQPAVTKVAAGLWITSTEMSRPLSTNTTAGNGNGFTTPPAGHTIDKTVGCAVTNKIPWTSITGLEAEQTCTRLGGSLCSLANWQTACAASSSCNYGYSPRGATCVATHTSVSSCNMYASYNFESTSTAPMVLPTASSTLHNCSADWSGLQSNSPASSNIYDLTGNMYELTKVATNQYAVMGGSRFTVLEDSARCGNALLTVDQTFSSPQVGFRCCFTADPTL